VSHSRKDAATKEVVRRGLDAVGLKPWFEEELVVGQPQINDIVGRIANSIGFFVFFTAKSTEGITRDWILFEMGLARAYDHAIFSWKRSDVLRDSIPKFLPELSKLNEYSVLGNGKEVLERQVRLAGKQVLRTETERRRN